MFERASPRCRARSRSARQAGRSRRRMEPVTLEPTAEARNPRIPRLCMPAVEIPVWPRMRVWPTGLRSRWRCCLTPIGVAVVLVRRSARRAGAVIAGCATVVSAVPRPATGVLTSQRRARNAVRAADPDRRSATSKADAGKTIDSAGARRADPRSRCPRHVPIAPRGVPAPARSLQRAAA